MVKRINSEAVVEEIYREAFESEIVIYGAGHYGAITRQYLQKKYNTDIKCFAVSSKKFVESAENRIDQILTIDEVFDLNSECILIIAVSEQKQSELIDIALKKGFLKIYLVLNEFLAYMKSELKVNKLKPLSLLNFEVHITDHCNLNCRGCIHFSPLSEESFLSIEEFKKDFRQMHELCGENVSQIVLLGGEPLLHPQITDFLYIARQYFKKCDLILLTNGILLDKMDEHFWQACNQNCISLKCTKYPIKVNYELFEKIARNYGVEITYQNDLEEGEKMMFKFPFDLQGTQPIKWNYEHCTRSNFCITLKHGKLFTCPLAAHAHIAKDFFDLDMELSNDDSIDIYKVHSFEEITKFLVTPKPFCRYCNIKVIPEQQKWSVSTKDFEEWF